MQEESIMNSMTVDQFNTSFVEDPNIARLKNSIVLIEKDLGIFALEQETHDNDVSSVIHRSMASLEATPIASKHNLSSCSEYSYNDSLRESGVRILDS